MNISTATTRLWWKEQRQLMPLLVSLPCLLIAMVLVIHPRASDQIGQGEFAILSMLPAVLFSVGAGAILVGQEKESRSLNWLSSLPISHRCLIANKLLAGLVGLVLLWLLGPIIMYLLISFFGHRWAPNADRITMPIFAYYFAHSIYLMFCGYATAWYFRSAMVSLIAIIPLACLPSLTANLVLTAIYWIEDRSSHRFIDVPMWLSFIPLGVGIIASGWIVFYAALANLRGPQPLLPDAPTWKKSLRKNIEAIAGWCSAQSVGINKPYPPATNGSLLWQFRKQNRVVVWSCYAALLISFPIALQHFATPDSVRSLPGLIGVPAISILFCSVCAMAILTFQGDNTRHQVRFLAERGVSPLRVWLSRQFFPLCFLGVAMFLCLVLISSQSIDSKDWWRPASVTRSTAILSLGIAYAISQWIGQLVSRLPIAAVASLAVSITAIQLARFEIDELEIPRMLMVGSLTLLPLAATLLMTQRWMDGHTGIGFWSRHLALAALAFVLSNVVWQSNLFLPASIGDEQQYAFALDAKQYQTNQLPTTQFQFLTNRLPEKGLSENLRSALPVDEDEWLERQYAHLSTACDGAHAIDVLDSQDFSRLLGINSKLRMKLDQAVVDRSTVSNQGTKQYNDWMSLTQKVAAGLRHSAQWTSQEYADRIEIYLLAELERPQTVKRLSRDTLNAIAQQVGNSDARWLARRRALILGWEASTGRSAQPKLGGFWNYPNGVARLTISQTRTRARQADLVVASLVSYIDEASKGNGVLPIQSLIDFWNLNPEVYGIGPSGPYFRVDDVRNFSISPESIVLIPAGQWGAGWEATGREWLNKVSASP